MATSRSRGRTSFTILAADLDGAVIGVLEAGDGAQQRRLAAARGADQHGEFAVGNVEVDAAHGMNAAIVLVQSGYLQMRHRNLSFSATHRAQRQAADQMALHQHAEDH